MLNSSIIFNLAETVGKAILVLCSIIVLVIIMLCIILIKQSPGKVRPLCDENGHIIEGSISEKIHEEINGTDMGMIIKSRDISNPVLLFVHGGPGMPEYPFTEEFPTGLEDNFTVVWWDQRGSGLSYKSDMDRENMTTDMFVSDIIEVSKYLCSRFGKEKIYLMGHSWGSYIGIKAAAEAPELYYAYIGIGQVSNQMESEKMAYDYIIDYYNEAGDKKTVEKLKKLDFKTKDYIPEEYNKIRDKVMHEAGIGTTHNMKSVVKGIFMPVMKNNEYTLGEKINIWKGKAFSNSTVLRDEMYKCDLRNSITEFKIPVYFFSGIYDYTVNYSLSEDYLKKINAPVKGFYLFKESAHSPIFEEPGEVMQIMMEDVKNSKNNLANIY